VLSFSLPCPRAATRDRTVRRAFDLGSALGGIFGDGEEEEAFEVPKDVAALVAGLKESTENTLNQAISRMDVELPPTYQLGVEGKKKQGRLLDGKIVKDDRKEVARGDRELARVFVEMLQPIAEGLVVVFRTKALARAAEREWKLTPGEGKIISFPEKAKSAFAEEVGAPIQFKRALDQANCQCLIVVGPYLDQLRLVNEVSNDVKDNMGIVLLNARIHGVDRTTLKIPPRLRRELRQTFVPSYHVRFLDASRKNSLIFRTTGKEAASPWIVAQQRELIGGQPVTQEVFRSDEEPTAEMIEEAFQAYEAKEKSVPDKLLDLVDKDKISR